jgi:hypothetical protein
MNGRTLYLVFVEGIHTTSTKGIWRYNIFGKQYYLEDFLTMPNKLTVGFTK